MFLFQLGLGDTLTRTRPVQVASLADKIIVAVCCGQYHSLALSDDYRYPCGLCNVWLTWSVHTGHLCGVGGFMDSWDWVRPMIMWSRHTCRCHNMWSPFLPATVIHVCWRSRLGKVWSKLQCHAIFVCRDMYWPVAVVTMDNWVTARKISNPLHWKSRLLLIRKLWK